MHAAESKEHLICTHQIKLFVAQICLYVLVYNWKKNMYALRLKLIYSLVLGTIIGTIWASSFFKLLYVLQVTLCSA